MKLKFEVFIYLRENLFSYFDYFVLSVILKLKSYLDLIKVLKNFPGGT